MVTLEEFKKSLGKKAQQLSEEEILEIRALQDKLAEMFFDNWIRKRNTTTTNAKD